MNEDNIVSGLTYYKLESPYSGDTTKNCKLTMGEVDTNFFNLKSNDIKEARFDIDTSSIILIKNNDETFVIDLTQFKEEILSSITTEETPDTPPTESVIEDLNMFLEIDSDGLLTLRWTTISGEGETSVRGLLNGLNKISTFPDTISGTGEKENPLRISNLELTSSFKLVLGIVDDLPSENIKNGDRYITKEEGTSKFGVLYTREGIEKIKEKLIQENSPWRVPTKEDWDVMLSEIETCDNDYSSLDVNIEQGEVVGKCLKSSEGWEDNENSNTINFSILPTYSADNEKSLNTDNQNAIFWTDTEYTDSEYYLKEFISNKDNINQINSQDGYMYSLRLIMDYNDNRYGFKSNIFGKEYEVIPLSSINQIWISTNLDELIGTEDDSKRFVYDSNTTTTKYYINHWNGLYWEKRELIDGDEVRVKEGYTNIEYHVIKDENGNTQLKETMKITPKRVIYDAGEY